MSAAQPGVIAEEIFVGDSEMGALMRSHDWSQTPLGSVEHWSKSLKVAVNICLNSRFPMVIWWGEELTLLYNDAWRPILGNKHPQALGKPGQEVWSEIWDIVGTQLHSVLTTGKATWSDDQLLLVNRYGYTEEAYFTYSYSPIFLETGEVGGAFTAVAETTQRVVGERRLATLRNLAAQTGQSKTVEQACQKAIQTLSENSSDIPLALLYLLNSEETQATLQAQAPAQIQPLIAPVELDLTQQSDPFTQALVTVIQSNQQSVIENLVQFWGEFPVGSVHTPLQQAIALPIRASTQDSMVGVLVLGANPYRALDDDQRQFLEMTTGHIANAIASARAYAEERKRAEALAELDRAKTAFFSNVSHEFRTPLTLMLGPLEEMLSKEGVIPPEQHQPLELIHRNSLRLLKLVNTLLDFSRIEAGRVQAVYEPTDLAALTAELASVFRSAIEQAGLQFIVACEPLPELIYVDREMWEKIVLNLLSNAFKFTFSGEIAVTLRQLHNQIELVVRDTGIGIPSVELPRLFERFHRVEGARGRTQEGSGIGLALVQELVRLHGGQVQVESIEGECTTFTLTIPTGMAHLPSDRIQATRTLASTALGAAPYVEEALRWLPEEESKGSRGRREAGGEKEIVQEDHLYINRSPASPARILLVDDNTDMRNYVKRLLLSQGYEVETAADGVAALAIIEQQISDLVLTDVMMPRLDGFGLLRELRTAPTTRDIPIIMLSARAGEEARIEGLEAGADDYLTKPFSARELLARVEATLKLAQLRQEATQREQVLRLEAEAAKQKVETILSSINDGFLVLDRNWCYTYSNDRYCKMIGMQQSEVLGRNIWELFPDVVDTDVYVQFQRAMTEQTPVQFEYFYPTWNRWFEYRVYPSADALTVFVADISDRKQAEVEQKRLLQELASERTRFEAVLGQMPEGVMIADAASGNLILANEQTNQILQYAYKLNVDLEVYEQRVPFQAYRTNGQPYAADEYPLVRSLQTGEVVTHEEMELHYPDGSRIVIDVNSSPIFDSQGQITSAVVVFQDITERKQGEVALQQSESRFRLMAEIIQDVFWMTDFRTPQILYVSPAYEQIWGKSPAEIYQDYTRWAQTIHPDDRERALAIAATCQDEDVVEQEYRIVRPDGTIRWIRDRGFAVRDEAGQIQQVVGVAQDITERQLAVEALKQSEARFRRLVEVSMFGVAIGDFSGNILYANDSLLNMIGYSREELEAGQIRWLDLTPPEQVHLDWEAGEELRQRGVCKAFEKEYIHKDGHRVPILIGAALLGEPYADQELIIGFYLDLTELKQAEATVRRSEQQLRVSQELSLDAFTILDSVRDETGAIVDFVWTYVNPKAAEILQRSVEELMGQRLLKVLPGNQTNSKLFERYVRVVETGEAHDIELSYSADGITGWFRNMAVKLEDGVAISFSDISDRKQIEEALRQSEERLRVAIASAQLGTWDWNLVTGELKWDIGCKAMFGLPPDAESSIEVFFEGVHPDDRDRLQDVVQVSLNPASGGVYDTEYRTIGIQDNVERWIRAKGQAYFDAAGKPLRFIGTVLDITEQKQAAAQREQLLQREQAAREAAERANRIKDEFLAVLSHELRSPLNPILGWAKLLQTRQFDAQGTKRALQTIERNAKLQAQLIEDLLDVSRILRGKMVLNVCPVNLVTVVESALETVRLAAQAKQIQIQTVLSRENPEVSGDAARLQQIVWNLLSNAVKFTPDGGRVEVSLSLVNRHSSVEGSDALRTNNQGQMTKYAQIQVKDTGKGISPDFLPYVFDYFRQEDGKTTRKFGGLGLGLAIVRHLTELHGGTVHAESLGEGQGATFIVRLPLMIEATELAKENLTTAQFIDLSQLRILVVDDDEDMRELTQVILEQQGAQVIVAATAAEALRVFDRQPPDIFIGDIGMPEIDGYMLMQQIRSRSPEQGGLVSAIALTAYAGEYDQQQALKAGFQRHVAKPVEPEALVRAIADLVRNR